MAVADAKQETRNLAGHVTPFNLGLHMPGAGGGAPLAAAAD